MDRTRPARAPTRIRSYVIGKTIGKGNFAVVKCAKHTSANIKVSVCYHDLNKIKNSAQHACFYACWIRFDGMAFPASHHLSEKSEIFKPKKFLRFRFFELNCAEYFAKDFSLTQFLLHVFRWL